MKIASLAEVKSKFSTYLKEAKESGPVIITRNGKAVAVILAPVDDRSPAAVAAVVDPRTDRGRIPCPPPVVARVENGRSRILEAPGVVVVLTQVTVDRGVGDRHIRIGRGDHSLNEAENGNEIRFRSGYGVCELSTSGKLLSASGLLPGD